MKFILKYMTLKEVREFGKVEVCVLPWGSCEPHNLHLPYGCDTLTIEKLAEISCQKAIEKGAKVILLPSIPVGYNAEHFKFPLALNFYPSTQISILNDIIFSLENHKIYKLVIMNGHGGNHINTLLQEVYGRTKVHIFLIEPWRVRRDITEKLIEEKGGCHAHEEETSTMMYLYPEFVHIEWADDGKTNEPRFEEMKKGWVYTISPWHLLTKESGCGNPKKANSEKGKIIVEAITDRVAEFLVNLSNSQIDERFPYK